MLLLPTSSSPRFRFTLHSDLLGPLVLSTDPLGWDELGVHISRDPKVHGLTTEYTVQLGYVKAGRAYLRRAYEAAGIEADVRQTVEQLDPNEFSWLPYHAGRVNLTSAEFSRLQVKTNVENEDFTQKFLNRDTVAVDLFSGESVGGSAGPIPTPQHLTLHSRALVKRFDGRISTPFVTSPGAIIDDESRSQTFYFGFPTVTTNEIGLQETRGGFVSGDAYAAVPIFLVPDSGEYVIELGAIVDVVVQSSGGTGSTFSKIDTKFHYRINGDPSTARVLAVENYSGAADGYYTHRFTIAPQLFTEQLQPEDKIYFYAEVYVHEIVGPIVGSYQFAVTATEQPGTYLRIRANTKTTPTPTAGLLAYEAFERVAQALTDAPDAFRSTFFGRPDTAWPQPMDGPGALTLVTGGFQVRGFPLTSDPAPAPGQLDSRKSLYATWRELYDSFSAVYALGYGIELSETGKPIVRVEDFGYWYPATVVLDLTVPGPAGQPAPTADILTKVAADRHFQQLEFGYTAWQAEQVNGLEEPNTKRQWTTPLTRVTTTYSQLSKYSASGQLLETTRRQRYINTDTTDNRSDNSNFIVCLLRRPDGSFETERNQRFSTLTGLLDPDSVYNARLTPARNLRRHGAIVRAGLEPAGTRRIRFSFGEGNNELVSQLVGEAESVAEKGDIRVDALAGTRWRPESDTFTLPVSRRQLQALLAFPHGRIRYFDDQHAIREGWILDFKHNGKEQMGTFALLPCAD